jgi:hypothetical protein
MHHPDDKQGAQQEDGSPRILSSWGVSSSWSATIIRSLNIVRCSHNNYRIVLMAMYEHRSF